MNSLQHILKKKSSFTEEKFDALVMFFIVVIIFSINMTLSRIEIYSGDACEYLEAGRNLYSGKGFIYSYNRFQSWIGEYFPWFPYSVPIYPIIIGLIDQFAGFHGVVTFNMFLWGLNCALIYRILRFKISPLAAFLSTMALGLSKIGTIPALIPWTEHLHLFFILLALLIYLGNEQRYWVSAVIFILGSFVRFSGIINFFGFCVAIALSGTNFKESFKRSIKILFLFIVIFTSYEAFCLIKYGLFYPQYPVFGKNWVWSQIFPGGSYIESPPYILLPSPQIDLSFALSNITHHFVKLFQAYEQYLMIVSLSLIFPVRYILKRDQAFWTTLWSQGLISFLFFPLSLWWFPGFEGRRYGLTSFIFLGMLGFTTIKLFMDQTIHRSLRPQLIFCLFMLAILTGVWRQYVIFTEAYKSVYQKISGNYIEDRSAMKLWIQNHVGTKDLIATEFDQDSCVFKRPIITLPNQEMRTQSNFKDFIKIFQPKYFLVGNKDLIQFLGENGFEKKFEQGVFTILERQAGL